MPHTLVQDKEQRAIRRLIAYAVPLKIDELARQTSALKKLILKAAESRPSSKAPPSTEQASGSPKAKEYVPIPRP